MKLNKKGQAENEGTSKIIFLIIALVVLVLVIIFFTNPALRDYIKNLPSFGHEENKNVDGIVEDEKIPGFVDKCPVKIGRIVTENSGAFVKRSCIYFGNACTGLYIDDFRAENEPVYYLAFHKGSNWLTNSFWWTYDALTPSKKKTIGGTGITLKDVSKGIEKRIITVENEFLQPYSADKYPGLFTTYLDMKNIDNSYIYQDQDFGRVYLCKEK